MTQPQRQPLAHIISSRLKVRAAGIALAKPEGENSPAPPIPGTLVNRSDRLRKRGRPKLSLRNRLRKMRIPSPPKTFTTSTRLWPNVVNQSTIFKTKPASATQLLKSSRLGAT